MPRYDPRVKAQIIVRVAEGETVLAISGESGMPTESCVQRWRRRDGLFAAELAAAHRRGAWRRQRAFDEAKAAAFLARVRAGERIRDLLGRPGMPSQGAYAFWRRTNGAFQEALWRLRGARNQARSGRGNPRWRAWDAEVGDRVLVAVMKGAVLRRLRQSHPALPCARVVLRWRREQPEFDRTMRLAIRGGARVRNRTQGMCTPALIEAIGERIIDGASLSALGREAGMPSRPTLTAWMARRPDFAAEVRSAKAFAAEMADERRQAAADRRAGFAPVPLGASPRAARGRSAMSRSGQATR